MGFLKHVVGLSGLREKAWEIKGGGEEEKEKCERKEEEGEEGEEEEEAV